MIQSHTQQIQISTIYNIEFCSKIIILEHIIMCHTMLIRTNLEYHDICFVQQVYMSVFLFFFDLIMIRTLILNWFFLCNRTTDFEDQINHALDLNKF